MNKKILLSAIILVAMFLFIPLLFIRFGIDAFYIKLFVLGATVIKTLFFILRVIKQEIDLLKIDQISQRNYFLLVCGSVFLIIFSFGADFFILQLTDKQSFTGIPLDTPVYKIAFKMFYFSSLFFFWMGVANILPNSTCTEFVTWAESLTTFFTLYYGTLNFVNFKKETNSSH